MQYPGFRGEQSISATSALTATAERRNRSHARDVSGEGRELDPECHRSSINRNEHIVVAIDVGTAFSGYAMSSSRDKFTIYAMRADDVPVRGGPSHSQRDENPHR